MGESRIRKTRLKCLPAKAAAATAAADEDVAALTLITKVATSETMQSTVPTMSPDRCDHHHHLQQSWSSAGDDDGGDSATPTTTTSTITTNKSSSPSQPHPQPPLSTSLLCTSLSTTIFTISLTVLLVVVLGTSLCNANGEENSRFSLRPFLHQASPPQPLSRRQEVLSFDHLDSPVARLPPPPPEPLVPINLAPVPRHSTGTGSGNLIISGPSSHSSPSTSGHKPSFQRIRLSTKPVVHHNSNSQSSGRQNLPPLPPFPASAPSGFTPIHFSTSSNSESPLSNFQRVAGFNINNNGNNGNGNNLGQPNIPAQPADLPQRQSFRRVKPSSSSSSSSSSSGARRIKLKTASPSLLPVLAPTAPVQPLAPISSRVPTPSSPLSPQRLRGRGPVNGGGGVALNENDDDFFHKDNALDNEDGDGVGGSPFFGNRVNADSSSSGGGGDDGIQFIGTLSRPPTLSSTVAHREPKPTSSHHHRHKSSTASVHTPTIPLTYYTTFTYFTTVLRGHHTATLSREMVSSTTAIKPIDRSIVTAIEFSEGYIQPSRSGMVALGTKTKGQTTTIYNVASRVQVFNDDLYKVIYATRGPTSSSLQVDSIEPTRITSLSSSAPSSSSFKIEPTRVHSRPLASSSSVQFRTPISPTKLEELDRLPKKLLTKYTYFYTFIDGFNTRYSTRMEESTAPFTGHLATMAPALDSSIDAEGNLQLLSPKSATVALGSRAHGHMTTVVNLALNNYISFDIVRDVRIKPTSVLASAGPEVKPTPSPSLTPSFDGTSEVVSSSRAVNHFNSPDIASSSAVVETPRLSSDILSVSSTAISPSSSSKIQVSSSSVRGSRPGSSRRPIRVKVKPIRSKLATLSRVASSRIAAASSSQLLELASSSGIFSSSDIFSSQSAAISPSPSSTELHPVSSTSISELSSSADISSSTPSSRKKVAFTVRRPSVSGSNRYFHRRPSSYLVRSSSTLLQSSPVAGPESTSTELLLSPSASSSFDSSSLPTVSYIPSTNLLSASMDTSFLLTPVLKPSKVSKSRLVVLTRLAGNLNRWNPLYASRIRVSSRKVLKSTSLASSDLASSAAAAIEPTSTVETIFETTTHTVPFTLGSTTIYTTVEETNSRVVTRSEMESDMSSSSSVDLLSPSFEPEVMSSTAAVKATESVSLSSPVASTVTFETRTSLTTLTHFNTIYSGDTSVVTSSEQTLSSLFSVAKMAPVSSTVVTETVDAFTTSTLYSTYTYFATLFNGTQTRITPLEEVKTEYLTLREPVTITRTIIPSAPPASIMATSVMSSGPSSSVVVVAPSTDGMINLEGSFATETISTHTTLTHFITLFSGTRTILSSIEEISPTVMTRTRALVQSTASASSSSGGSSMSTSTTATTEQPSTDSTTRLSPSIVEMASGPMMGATSSSSTSSSSSSRATISSRRKSLMSPTRKLETSSSVLFNKDQIDKDVGSAMPTAILIGPSTTLVNEQQSSSSTAVLKPGSVIELNDLLQGVNNAGQIGETIKDIVNNIVTRPDMSTADDDSSTTTTTSSSNGDETTISTTTDPTTDGPLTTSLPDGSISTLAPSFSGKTPMLGSSSGNGNKQRPDAKFPVYIPNQTNLPKYYMTTSEEKVIFSTQTEEGGDGGQPPVSTRYVTSVEKAAKTLTLTSTKVYYTRDSPLTITSIHTTTLPPITYVSTIIGSKTILGTYNSITPTRSSTMMDTASAATSSMTPSSSATTSAQPAPTTRPRLHRPKNQDQQQQPPLLKAKVTPFLSSQPKNGKAKNGNNKAATLPPSIFMNASLEAADLCTPACNATNKEYCKVEEAATSAAPGKYTCECRPGYVRRPSDGSCQEIKNYLVVVRVSKTAESEVAAHHTGNEVQSFTRVARRLTTAGGRGLDAEGIADLQVLSVERSSRSQAATMVNLTIQLDPSLNRNVQDDLSRKLSSLGQVEKVVDFDECTSPLHNDCSPRARCINEPGTYRCQCLESFIDLDAVSPGRHCVSEVKSCDYCYGRGDCWRSQANTVCRCHPMFIGRRCEINGLLLAILVPIIAILVIVAIIAFLYCSRKLRNRNRRFKNLAAYGPVAVIGGTLDRKAMLETSSESSDPQHRSSHYNSESNPASARGSMARRNGTGNGGGGNGNGNGAHLVNHSGQDTVGRRPSEPSLDRSLGTYSATGSAYNSMPPQILIPRARPPYTIHPGQVYMW